MKRFRIGPATVTIRGVRYDGFTELSMGSRLNEPRVEPTGPASANVFIGFDPGTEIPYEDVSQAERMRMEADARLRAEQRLRDWSRG